MKSKQVFQAFLLLLLTVAMLLQVSAAIVPADGDGAEDPVSPVISEEETGRVLQLQDIAVENSIKVTFMVNGEEIDSNADLDYNADGLTFRIKIQWEVMDGDVLSTADTVEYQLPTNLLIDNTSGNLDAYGTYEIRNNILYMQFNEEYIGLSNRYGHVSFSGTLTAEQLNNGEGGEYSFCFPGTGSDFIIHVEPDRSNDLVNVEKADGVRVPGADGIFRFLVKLTSQYDSTDISVTDVLQENLELVQGSVRFFKDRNCTQPYEGSFEKMEENASGFVYKIAQMSNGEELYLQYDVTVKAEAYKDPSLKEGLMNTVTVRAGKNEESDTGSVTINKTWVEKSGKYNDGKVDWTIIINKGDKLADIAGTVIKDIPGTNQTYVPGSLAVYESEDGNDFTESALEITWEALTSESGYTFPEGSNKVYKINYSTEVTTISDLGQTVVRNKVVLSPWGDGSIQKEASVTIGTKRAYKITKKCLTPDSTSRTVEWEVSLQIPEGGIKNLQADDKMPPGMDLVEGSVEVTGGQELIPAGYPQCRLSKTEAGNRKVYTVYFGNKNYVTQPGTITFRLKTEFIDGVIPYITSIFTNQVWEKEGAGINLAHGRADYKWDKHLAKSVYEGDVPKGSLGWQLEVGRLPENAAEAVITDNMPEYTSYAEGSLQVLKNDGRELTDYASHITPSENGQTLTFAFDDTMISLAKSESVSLRYQLKIDRQEEAVKEYNNMAQLTVDGEDYGWVSAVQKYTREDAVKKTGEYNYETAPYVHYTIEVNPDAMDLSAGEDTIELTDVLADGLSFIMGSLKINGDTVPGDKYSYDFETRKLTLTVPDSRHLTVTYAVKVDLSVGTSFTDENGKNICKLEGTGNTVGESSVILRGKVLESAGGAGGDGVMLTIYKYGTVNTEAVEDAQFKIYEVEVKDGRAEGEKELNGTYKSGADGYVTIAGLRRDILYKLVEIEAPRGFQRDTAPVYVVFKGNSGIDWSRPIEGIDGQITVVGPDKSTFVLHWQNSPPKGSLEIEKIFSGVKETELSDTQKRNITFRVTGPGNYSVTVTYDQFVNGKYLLTDLQPGEYRVSEISKASVEHYSLSVSFSPTDGKATVDGNNKAAVTVTNNYRVETGKISAVKKVSLLNSAETEAYKVEKDTTYYMALFKDQEGKERYTSYPVREAVIKTGSSVSAPVVWEDLPLGIYYVFETDSSGAAIPLGEKQTETDGEGHTYSYICTVAEGKTNKVELTARTEGSVELENIYLERPGGYYYKGQIHISKKVLKNGSPYDTDTKFYAGIFTKDENGNYVLADMDGQSQVITLKNNGTVTAEVILGGEKHDGSEPVTYYVMETDQYGDLLDPDVFAYTVSGEGEVTLTREAAEASITITNTAKKSTHELDILKVDENNNPLAGAKFTMVYEETDSAAWEWTSTKSAKPLTLIPGTYTLSETEAPAGYTKGSDVTITVSSDGTVKVSGDNISYKDGVIRFMNRKNKTSALKPDRPGTATVSAGKTTTAANKAGGVKTGDETAVWLYLIILAVAAVTTGIIIYLKKYKK